MPKPVEVSFTVVYETAEDGWIVAHVLERPGAVSQGRTRAEARAHVQDALRELLLHDAEDVESAEAGADVETLTLTFSH